MLGVSKTDRGHHFSIFSHNATAVSVRLFRAGDRDPFIEKPLERSGDIWSTQIEGTPKTFEYTYRCDGPYDFGKGHLFNKDVDLIDPYAKRLNGALKWNQRGYPTRGVVMPLPPFDWEGDFRPMIPLDELVVYEMHVRGFTRDESSHAKYPGSFLGVIEKIPHLIELGINAVELLPIQTFNERENLTINPENGKRLFNYWGYSTENFFTPMNRYGTPEDLKMLIKMLHRHNIEVLLDVVYNHTSEGSQADYYHSFRGIDNATYYMMDEEGYCNYSGCGNTLNCNHPIVQQLIIDSLRTFVMEYHIDGFRFDLASILTRGLDGHPMTHPPLIDRITRDPILAPIKLIAESWDLGGLYQVGSFPSWKFGEWNDQFRDQIRRFIRGAGNKNSVKNKLMGSPDLFSSSNKSYNFITIHDGFSMYDLVSYNQKHNEMNGENNRDGCEHNESWNCGVEGVTEDVEIAMLRRRQMCNFFVALLLSKGIPMILMGDEYGHTKLGNNNAWCQDNPLNYFLWDELEKNRTLFHFVAKIIKIRKTHLKGNRVRWCSPIEGPILAYTIEETLLVAFNTSAHACVLDLPKGQRWNCLVDSLSLEKEGEPIASYYTLASYSSIVLVAT